MLSIECKYYLVFGLMVMASVQHVSLIFLIDAYGLAVGFSLLVNVFRNVYHAILNKDMNSVIYASIQLTLLNISLAVKSYAGGEFLLPVCGVILMIYNIRVRENVSLKRALIEIEKSDQDVMRQIANIIPNHELIDYMVTACSKGCVRIVSSSLNTVTNEWLLVNGHSLVQVCIKQNHINVFKVLVQREPILIYQKNHSAFLLACNLRRLDMIQYMCELENKNVIYYYDNDFFVMVKNKVYANLVLCDKCQGYQIYSDDRGKRLFVGAKYMARVLTLLSYIRNRA